MENFFSPDELQNIDEPKQPKIYCGFGKPGINDSIILSLDPKGSLKKHFNSEKCLRFSVGKMRNPTEYSTHYIYVDPENYTDWPPQVSGQPWVAKCIEKLYSIEFTISYQQMLDCLVPYSIKGKLIHRVKLEVVRVGAQHFVFPFKSGRAEQTEKFIKKCKETNSKPPSSLRKGIFEPTDKEDDDDFLDAFFK